MLDLLCMCRDNFATIQHLDVMAAATFVLFFVLVGSAVYLQYAIFNAGAVVCDSTHAYQTVCGEGYVQVSGK